MTSRVRLTTVALLALVAVSGLPAALVVAAPQQPSPPRTVTIDDVVERLRGDGTTPSLSAPEVFTGLGIVGSGAAPELRVRTRSTDGDWSDWTDVEPVEHGPADDSAEAAGSEAGHDWSTEAVWSGDATALQLDLGDARPRDVEVALLGITDEPSTWQQVTATIGSILTPQPAHAAEAISGFVSDEAAAHAPDIVTRDDWGAYGGDQANDDPVYRDVKMGVLHHTATTSPYSRDDAEQLIRNIQQYHTDGRGWDDIGYNFLVDRFGRIYEGRAGGIDLGVQGAHVAGWNAGSFGVAALGDFGQEQPPQVMLDAIAELFAFKYAVHDIDPAPDATTRMNGETVDTMAGHRDHGQTTCPGWSLYSEMDGLRAQISQVAADKHAGAPYGVGAIGSDRIAGSDRYATSAALAEGAAGDTVYVATGEAFPDALAAGPVAGAREAAVLLTGPEELPAATRDALDALAPSRIVLVGGTAAVSPEVEEQLSAYAPVRRESGVSRYETAAQLLDAELEAPDGQALLASGVDFPDALAGAAIAAGDRHPLLLTDPDRLPVPTRHLLDELRPSLVTALGGTVAVSEDTLAEAASAAGASTDRIQGKHRYGTSARIVRDRYASADEVLLATGKAFADALAAAPAAARRGTPLLLVGDDLPAVIAEEITRLQPDRILAVGGDGAVDDSVVAAARGAAAAAR